MTLKFKVSDAGQFKTTRIGLIKLSADQLVHLCVKQIKHYFHSDNDYNLSNLPVRTFCKSNAERLSGELSSPFKPLLNATPHSAECIVGNAWPLNTKPGSVH